MQESSIVKLMYAIIKNNGKKRSVEQMKQTYKAKRIITFALILSILAVLSPSEVHAKIFTETQTSVKIKIEAMGQYINWDGVSNVSQFLDEKGELCFAFDNGKYVSVVKTKNGKPASKDIKLKKKSSIFGAVTCDKNGKFLCCVRKGKFRYRHI